MSEKKTQSLEELFEILDQVVSKLEKDDITLEESFNLYQQGMELLKQCNKSIDTVEKKVRLLDEKGEYHEF